MHLHYILASTYTFAPTHYIHVHLHIPTYLNNQQILPLVITTVVNVLAFYTDDPSSNPTGVQLLFSKIV